MRDAVKILRALEGAFLCDAWGWTELGAALRAHAHRLALALLTVVTRDCAALVDVGAGRSA